MRDVRSLGCMIIELITGNPPYFELQSMSALFRIVQDPHPPLPDAISDELIDFLKQCFRKDPKERPSAESLLRHRLITKFQRDEMSERSRRVTSTYEEGLTELEKMIGGKKSRRVSAMISSSSSGQDVLEEADVVAGLGASSGEKPEERNLRGFSFNTTLPSVLTSKNKPNDKGIYLVYAHLLFFRY
jgi:serine/threonine protein kinase